MNKIKPSLTQPGNNPKKATNTKNSSRCPEHRDTLKVNTAIKCVNAGRLNTKGVGALKKKWFFSVSMRMRRIKCARIQWGEGQSPRMLVGTYVKERDNNRMKGGETGIVFWSKVYLSIREGYGRSPYPYISGR